MRDLFFRIWRYLNYPADTNEKVTEVWQRVQALCEEFTIKSNHLQNEFQEKTDNFQREFQRVEADLEHLKSSLYAIQDRLGHVYNHLNSGLPWLPADQRLDQNPEFLLLAHLVSYFEEPIAFDVGANEGALTKVLLDAGFEVYAFEPYPPSVDKLRKNLGDNSRLHVLGIAVGSEDTTLALHIAEGGSDQTGEDPSVYNTFRPHFVASEVSFSTELQVPVRSLSSLVAKKEAPSKFQILKVDTEGFDLEVIRGLGQLQPAVVQTEFWGEGFLFVKQQEAAKLALGREIIKEMRSRGYRWNLIMFRQEGVPAIRLAANLANVPDRSWGNIFFFTDYRLFEEAYRWSQGALPQYVYSASPHAEAGPVTESGQAEAPSEETPVAEASGTQTAVAIG
jgi:FkbM family methyltransferase